MRDRRPQRPTEFRKITRPREVSPFHRRLPPMRSTRFFIIYIACALCAAGLLYYLSADSEESPETPTAAADDTDIFGAEDVTIQAGAPPREVIKRQRAVGDFDTSEEEEEADAPPMPKDKIVGIVKNGLGLPVANCRVWFTPANLNEGERPKETATDSQGAFCFEDCRECYGYLDAMNDGGEAAKSYYFERNEDTHPVELRVDGAPAVGAILNITNPRGDPASNADVYVFGKLKTTKFTANRAGYCKIPARKAFSAVVVDAERKFVAFNLGRVAPSTQEVSVQFTKRAPRIAFNISNISKKDYIDPKIAVVDEGTGLSLGNFEAGSAARVDPKNVPLNFARGKIYIWYRGFAIYESDYLDFGSAPPHLDITLERAQPVVGTIFSGRESVSGAIVQLYQNDRCIDRVLSDENGRFLCYPMYNIPATVTIGAGVNASTRFPKLKFGPFQYQYDTGALPLDVQIPAAGGLEYLLVDSTGAPIEGRPITLFDKESYGRTVETDGDGKCNFIDISPGTYYLRSAPVVFDINPNHRSDGDRPVEIEGGKTAKMKIVSALAASVRTNIIVNGVEQFGFRGSYLSLNSNAPFRDLNCFPQRAQVFLDNEIKKFDAGSRELRIVFERRGEFEMAFRKQNVVLRPEMQQIDFNISCGSIEGTIKTKRQNLPPDWIILTWYNGADTDACGSVRTFGDNNIYFNFPHAPAGKCKLVKKSTGQSIWIDVEEGKCTKVELK